MRYTTNVTWRYISGFYDGPLSGLAVLPDGTEAWAIVFEECDQEDAVCGFYRRYRLIKMTSEAAEWEAMRHAAFQRYVGTHWDFGEDGNRGTVAPNGLHRRYYEAYPPHSNEWEPEGALIGWFQV